MSKLKVGIVGTGFSARCHLDALSRLRNVELVALADQTLELAAAAAREFAVPRAYGSYQELLSDPDVQVVHNCTPNHLHAEINAAVLKARRHLLSEKPLAIDSKETAALVELAAAAERDGVVSGVCFNYRFFPLVRQARAMLASGEHGPVHFIHGSYLQDWLLYDTDWNWRLETERNGESRAVADIGSHWSDAIQFITGDRIAAVFADLATLHKERLRPAGDVQTFTAGRDVARVPVPIHTEDFGTVLVRFESGTRGVFSVSQVSAGRKNRLYFEIDAARAALAWDQEEPNKLWVGQRGRGNIELVRDAALLAPEAARFVRFPGGHPEGWPDGLRNLFHDFYDTVTARLAGTHYAPSFATLAEGHRLVQLVEAILASHRTGRWVQVGEAPEVQA